MSLLMVKPSPLIQYLVDAATLSNTVSRQSAQDDTIDALSGSAIGRAPGLSLRKKNELKFGYLDGSGCSSSAVSIE